MEQQQFLYDKDRKLKDLKLVDYQLTFWGTVASDIYYFMVSSWNVDIKIKKFDELIRFYFDQLIGNLTTLKYEKIFPTFEQLEKELLRRSFFGKIKIFFVQYLISILISASASTVTLLPFPHTKKPISEEGFLDEYYTNPTVVKALSEIIPWLDQRGALDLP